MPSYDALKKKQAELIRKALDGSVFVAAATAAPIAGLTQYTAATTTTPEIIDLKPLPAGWDDLGFLSNDGAAFSRDIATSEVTSWGSITPSRTDVTSDTTTITVMAQETKLLTLGVATGADLAAITRDANSGEVRIAKPARPKSRHWRVLSLAVDEGDGGEIYLARFLPRAKPTSYAEQSHGGGDDPIGWGVTMTGEVDSTLGYSEQWLFGGPGWDYLLVKMGFPAT